MLNDYHRQFLRHLLQTKCRFLLIGGQARCLQTGTPTRDLDILVDISPTNRQALKFALRFWKTAHPLHSTANLDSPLDVQPCRQIKFPDGDGCGYVTTLGKAALIDMVDGVDVLTSLRGMDFDELYSRSLVWNFEGHTVRMICREDLEQSRKLGEHIAETSP